MTNDNSTTRQRVLAYIVAYKQGHDGTAPTLEEIRDAVGLASKSTVNLHLRKLAESGQIERGFNLPRDIRVPGGRWFMEADVMDTADAKVEPFTTMWSDLTPDEQEILRDSFSRVVTND